MILKFRDGTWALSKCYCNSVLRNINLKLPYGMDYIQISKAWHAPSSQVLLIRHLIVSTCSNKSSKTTTTRATTAGWAVWNWQRGSGKIFMGATHIHCCSTHKCVFLSNVTQFFQQYKINCQESLVQQRNNQPSTNFVTFVDKFIKWYFMKDKSILASRKLDGRLQLKKTAFGTCMAILLTHYQFHYFNWCNKVDSSNKRKGISLIKIFVEILFQTEKSTLTEQ